jgi:hypothetical protein
MSSQDPPDMIATITINSTSNRSLDYYRAADDDHHAGGAAAGVPYANEQNARPP